MSDSLQPHGPGSSVHGILQARILKWAAISYSWGSSQLRDRIHVSCTGRRVFYGELPYSLTMTLWFSRGRTLLLFCCLDLHGKPEAEKDGLCLVTPSCLNLCGVMDSSLSDSFVHRDSPGKNTGVSCHFLSMGSSQPRD